MTGGHNTRSGGRLDQVWSLEKGSAETDLPTFTSAWQVSNGKGGFDLVRKPVGFRDDERRSAFTVSPDGRFAVLVTMQTVVPTMDLVAGKQLPDILCNPEAWEGAFTPDGSVLAVGKKNGASNSSRCQVASRSVASCRASGAGWSFRWRSRRTADTWPSERRRDFRVTSGRCTWWTWGWPWSTGGRGPRGRRCGRSCRRPGRGARPRSATPVASPTGVGLVYLSRPCWPDTLVGLTTSWATGRRPHPQREKQLKQGRRRRTSRMA
jgi:hypothetical protein